MGRRCGALVVGLFVALCAPAQAVEPYASTAIRDVGGAALTGEPGSALLAFTARQDVLRSAAGTRLGGARIPRSPAFDGLWAYGGDLGAWFEAPAATATPQLQPRTGLVEQGDFESTLTAEGAPLAAGDRVEYGMSIVSGDAPLDTTRPRGAATGSLAWRPAVASREVTSRFGTTSATLDAIMIRADIVAVGGDVDARRAPVDLPPLVVDLPRTYQPGARYVGAAAMTSPYVGYVTEFNLVPAPEAGKAIMRARVSGYVPEARTRRVAGGPLVREWHIPLLGVLAIDRGASALAVAPPMRAGLSLPAGGLARVVSSGAGPRLERLAPGGVLTAAADGDVDRADAAPASAAPPPAPDAETAAASFDRTATAARRIDLGPGGLAVTVDPDFRGEGLLALRDPLNLRIGRAFARLVTVPAVRRGQEVIRLERSRLTDLRVLPFRLDGGVRVSPTTSFAGGGPNQASTFSSRFRPDGVLVSAVYDLGDGEVARVDHSLFQGGAPRGGRVNTTVEIESLTRPSVAAYPLAYAEVAQRGTVGHDGAPRAEEFSGSGARPVSVGSTQAESVFRSDTRIFGGTVTALAAPAPINGRAPDPTAPITGRPLALVFTPPADPPAASATVSTFKFGLTDDPAPGVAARPAAGRPCGAIQVDGGAADVQQAWFDADPRTLYASVRLRELPTAASAPAGARYGVGFWHDSTRFEARATMTSTGMWSYEMRIGQLRLPLEGEITGNVIRIAAELDNFGFERGDVLRDVGAYAYAGTTEQRRERLPAGSTDAFGFGESYAIDTCPGTAPEVTATRLQLDPLTVAYGERAVLTGRLTDAAGTALAGEAVEVLLTADGAERVLDAVTAADGSVRFDAGTGLVPGRHTAEAVFEGRRDALRGATTSAVVEVRRAVATLVLDVGGSGASKRVDVLLHAAGTPLAGREVILSSGGAEVGRVTTAADGRARFTPPAHLRGAKVRFDGVFGGDRFYEPAGGGG